VLEGKSDSNSVSIKKSEEAALRMELARREALADPRPIIHALVILDRHASAGPMSTNKLLRLMRSHGHYAVPRLLEQLRLIEREKQEHQKQSVRKQPRTKRKEWRLKSKLFFGADDDDDGGLLLPRIDFSFSEELEPLDVWDTSRQVNRLTPAGKRIAQMAKETEFLQVTKIRRHRP
jgi:hypothetical protein